MIELDLVGNLRDLNVASVVLRLVLAMLFGGTIGFERGIRQRAAGLRTHMLLCVGSASTMLCSQFLYASYGVGDPARLSAQVISGIGFLGAGTMSNPEKGYHFEWKAENERLAVNLRRLMEKSGFPYQTYLRRNMQVIYIKEADQIISLLALMGASGSLLKMENIRVNKQTRLHATRAANCDEHNSERMLDAAQKQAEACRKISLQLGLFNLPPGLRELARKRMENPELSLTELGEAMEPPLGKSAVNHRLRRLMQIASELDQQQSGVH